MTGKENTSISTAMLTEAVMETAALESAAVSSANSTISNTGKQSKSIYDMLPCGRDNAIDTKTLVQLVGCKSSRSLQNLIAAERASGMLILSSSYGGYFRPGPGKQGKEEINKFYRTLRARALNTLTALRAAKVALGQIDGQIDLDDLEAETGRGERAET